MKQLEKIVHIALIVLSAYIIFDGLVIVLNTSGTVQGSEFGMLITLANQLGLVMTWLGLFAIKQSFQK